jgi:hypothetical protein
MKANEKRARALVYERSNGVCECCGMARATEWQHRLPRSVGGLWSPANGLHVCRETHRWIDDHPKDANALGWHLFTWDSPLLSPARLAQHGWVWLLDDGLMVPTTAPEGVAHG